MDLNNFRLPIADSYSDTQFEILKKYIQDYEKTIDDEHEVGLLLTNFGNTKLMRVTEISFEPSVMMIFKGYVDGVMSTLVQHISQLNFLITSVQRCQDNPKQPIGFSYQKEP